MAEDIHWVTRRLNQNESLPYDLLLLADEAVEAVERYINDSEIYVLEHDNKIIAEYVLFRLDKHRVEIKNIAVAENCQNLGIGKFLLKDAEIRAKEKGYREIIIGTPDIAVKQLAIYQKAGFELFDIKKDFFLFNYPDPVYEDGIQLKDMAMLQKKID